MIDSEQVRPIQRLSLTSITDVGNDLHQTIYKSQFNSLRVTYDSDLYQFKKNDFVLWLTVTIVKQKLYTSYISCELDHYFFKTPQPPPRIYAPVYIATVHAIHDHKGCQSMSKSTSRCTHFLLT